MLSISSVKDLLRDVDEVNTGGNRSMRRAISELRKEGIIFIAVGKWKYQRIETCSKKQKEKYFWKVVKQATNTYRQTVNPIKNYLTDEQLNYLHKGDLYD